MLFYSFINLLQRLFPMLIYNIYYILRLNNKILSKHYNNMICQSEIVDNSKLEIIADLDINTTQTENKKIYYYKGKQYIKFKEYLYEQKKLLGVGSYGKVFLGFKLGGDKGNNLKVAIKRIDIPKQQSQKPQIQTLVKTTKAEIQAYCNLYGNPNILELYDYGRVENSIYMVLQYCDQKDLKSFIEQKKKNRNLTQIQIRYYFMQILSGVKHYHQKKWAHRDLKPQNILVKDQILKISDFGFADCFTKSKDLYDATTGTTLTQAPEIIFHKNYSSKCDIYSLGCILYWMIYDRFPFIQIQMGQFLEKNIQYPEQIPISSELKSALKQMLRFQEQNRIDFKDLFQLPIFIMRQQPKNNIAVRHSLQKRLEKQIPTNFANYIDEKIQIYENWQAFNSIKKAVDYEFGKIQFFRHLSQELKLYSVEGRPELQKHKIQINLFKDLIIIGIQKYVTYRMDQLLKQLLNTAQPMILDPTQYDQFNKYQKSVKQIIFKIVNDQFDYLMSKTSNKKFQNQQKLKQRKCEEYRIFDNVSSIFCKQIVQISRFEEQLHLIIVDLISYLKEDIHDKNIHQIDLKKSRETIFLIHHLFMLYMQNKIFSKKYQGKINFNELIFLQFSSTKEDQDSLKKQAHFEKIRYNIKNLLDNFL